MQREHFIILPERKNERDGEEKGVCVCVCVRVCVRVCVKVRHLHWGDNSTFFTAKPNLNMQDPQGYLLKEENQYNSLGTISVSLSSTHTLTYIRTHPHLHCQAERLRIT